MPEIPFLAVGDGISVGYRHEELERVGRRMADWPLPDV